MVQALSTNTFTSATWIVNTDATKGTHTTLAGALTSASSGDTILLQSSVTENPTLKAGVNIIALLGSEQTPNVSITGKCTMTTAGTVTMSGIRFTTNSDFFLAVTGSAASIVNLENCYLNCLNNTGISHTSSSASSVITTLNCSGNLGTTGISYFTSTSAGNIDFQRCELLNLGNSITSSTVSTGQIKLEHTDFNSQITTSSVGSITAYYSVVGNGNANAIAITLAGTGSGTLNFCDLISGSSSAASIGTGTSLNLNNCIINTSNTNAITGAGTLTYTCLNFTGSSSVMNVTTQTPLFSNLGKYKATGQPCFSAYSNTGVANQTGDNTIYTIVFGTELFDQGSNFDGISTFTAPVTGRYQFNIAVLSQNNLVTHNPNMRLVTTANSFTFGNWGGSFAGNFVLTGSVIAPMTAGDTATVIIQTSNGTKTVGVYGAANDPRTIFSGMLVA